MADEEEAKVSAAYRALGAEEPPRALDEAILAAARRQGQSWTRRYSVPLSLAAVLVLAVTVTLRIPQEQSAIEAPSAPAPVAMQEIPLKQKAEDQVKSAAEPPARQRAKVVAKDEPQAFSRSIREQAPPAPAAVPAPAPAPAPAAPKPGAVASSGVVAALGDRRDAAPSESDVSGKVARQAEERTSRDADAAARAPQVGPVQALAKRSELGAAANQATAKSAVDTPEQELERIALLRREGKHDEADKALAEFRKRHPDYRIAGPMLERVERR